MLTLKKLAMCLLCVVLPGALGCGQKAGQRETPAAVGSAGEVTPHAAGVSAEKRGKLARQPDGAVAISSPDDNQVIILEKDKKDDKKDVYRVCNKVEGKLQCGDPTPIETPCTVCFAEPCPCTSPACTTVCTSPKMVEPASGGSASGSATP